MQIKNNILKIGNNQVSFDFNILETLEWNDITILLLEYPIDEPGLNLVFGVDKQCHIIWQIQDWREIYGFTRPKPYVSIFDQDGQIVCRDFSGRRFIIDPQTGKIIGKLQTLMW